MAINAIQFPKGLSLAQFMKEYGTEAQRDEALVVARWPQGFGYAHCTHKLAYEFRRRSCTTGSARPAATKSAFVPAR
ncbi:MAG: hypothetical protein V4508_16005 [Pseudomonadota bacterium]